MNQGNYFNNMGMYNNMLDFRFNMPLNTNNNLNNSINGNVFFRNNENYYQKHKMVSNNIPQIHNNIDIPLKSSSTNQMNDVFIHQNMNLNTNFGAQIDQSKDHSSNNIYYNNIGTNNQTTQQSQPRTNYNSNYSNNSKKGYDNNLPSNVSQLHNYSFSGNKLKKINSFNDILTVPQSELDDSSSNKVQNLNMNNSFSRPTDLDPSSIKSDDKIIQIPNLKSSSSNLLSMNNINKSINNNTLAISIKLKDGTRVLQIKEGEDIFQVVSIFVHKNNLSNELVSPITRVVNTAIVNIKSLFTHSLSQDDKSYISYLKKLNENGGKEDELENDKKGINSERDCQKSERSPKTEEKSIKNI